MRDFCVWIAWSWLTYYIGTRLFAEPQTRANPGELFRTLGFATTLGLFRILGAIPGLRSVVFIVGSLWMLAAMVVAVRQALDYSSTARAVGVCATGLLLSLIVDGVMGFVFSPRVY